MRPSGALKRAARGALIQAAAAACALCAAGCGDAEKSAPATPAEEARAAARRQCAALAKGDFKAFFLELPEPYQKDAADIVREFANTIDADIYEASRGFAAEFARIAAAKPDLMAEFLPHMPAKDISKCGEALRGLADDVSLRTLRKADIPALLGRPDSKTLWKLFATRAFKLDAYADAVFTKSVENGDGSVTVSYEENGLPGFASDILYRKIGVKWFCDGFFGSWERQADGLRASMPSFEFGADEKAEALNRIRLARLALRRAEDAGASDAMRQALNEALFPVAAHFGLYFWQ